MLKTDALRAFDNNVKAVADALSISVSAVYQWDEVVPPLSAMRLSQIRPDLEFDPDRYKDWYVTNRKRKSSSKRH